jgi:hypothetical protein
MVGAKLWIARTLFQFKLFATLVCLVFSQVHTSQPTDQPTSTSVNEESSPLETAHVILCDATKGLQIVTIPSSDASDQTITTKPVGDKPTGSGFPIGIYGGHAIWKGRNQHIYATDLQRGVHRTLVSSPVAKATYSSGHLYYIAKLTKKIKEEERTLTHELTHIDLTTLKSTAICKLAYASEKMLIHGPVFALHASPDGTQVAVSDMRPAKGIHDIMTRVVFAKAGSTKTIQTAYDFRCVITINGGGDSLAVPSFRWVDNATLLFAGYENDGAEFELKGARFMPLGGEPMKISRINAIDGTYEDISQLPKGSRPEFVKGFPVQNNEVVLQLRRQGSYTVNTNSGEVKETKLTANCYNFTNDLKSSQLSFGDTMLQKNRSKIRFYFSPDNRRVAWLSYSDRPQLGFRQDPLNRGTPLYLHDPIHGKRLLYAEPYIFDPDGWEPSVKIAWATESELQPAESLCSIPDVNAPRPQTAKKLSSKPPVTATRPEPRVKRKDSRPAIRDCIDIAIETDKQTYQRHEQISFTLSVKNKSKQKYRFTKKQVTRRRMPFGVTLKNSGGIPYYVFDKTKNEFEGEYLDLVPDQTIEIKRTIEAGKQGIQELSFEFQSYGDWSGRLVATANFEVLESTTPELLQKKFDRLMANCLGTWTGPTGGGLPASNFWQLGSAGEELLVTYLRNCKDPHLQNALCDGLRSSTNESTLDYFENRIATDMEHDRKSVIRCLAGIEWRARYNGKPEIREKAKSLLLAVARHKNAAVRLAAISKIARALGSNTDAFMLEATADKNDKVATVAARYVAVRQKLTLKEWLEFAIDHPTRPTKLALRSFASQLSLDWDFESDFEDLEQEIDTRYVDAIHELIQWCEKNPRTSAVFFDGLRLKALDENTLTREQQQAPIKMP